MTELPSVGATGSQAGTIFELREPPTRRIETNVMLGKDESRAGPTACGGEGEFMRSNLIGPFPRTGDRPDTPAATRQARASMR